MPWSDDDVVDTRGRYLGTIVDNRPLGRCAQPYRGYPGHPGYPGYPGYSGNADYTARTSGFTDVRPAALLLES